MQKDATESIQSPVFDNVDRKISQVILAQQELVEATEHCDNHDTEIIRALTGIEEFEAKLSVDEDTGYEVFTSKLDEQCEREIPIFLDDRDYLIPSQVTRNTEEAEVIICSLINVALCIISHLNNSYNSY